MSRISARQIKMLQIARKKVEKISDGFFDDAAHQMLLINCGVKPDAVERASTSSPTSDGPH
jgi:hypothetical protein